MARTIRRIAPKTCKRCDATGTLYLDDDRQLRCRLCGAVQAGPEAVEPTPQPPPEPRRRQYRVTYGIEYKGSLGVWARSAYDTGLTAVEREAYDEAIAAFRRAIDDQPDFIDAHLWIARLSEDEAVRRDHLGTVLAHNPGHIEAVRELMVLNGQLSQEEADRAADSRYEPEVIEVDTPVGIDTTQLKCPTCGGSMRLAEDGESRACEACGHTELLKASSDYGMRSLSMAILKRRGQLATWKVGARLLKCENCSSERTLTANRLNTRCPFCGSSHVIERDVFDSFVQPDGIVPFIISEDEAETALNEALNSFSERLKGIFVENRVSAALMEAVYLPFWLFDATLQVMRTIQPSGLDQMAQRDSRLGRVRPLEVRRESFTEMAADAPVCAVRQPPRHLTDRLGRYDLERMVAYNAEALTDISAEIYSVDFEKASIIARGQIGDAMRLKYTFGELNRSDISVNTMVQHMSFRLALLPVWVILMREKDGDLRQALINGQTGHLVLGDARKNRRR